MASPPFLANSRAMQSPVEQIRRFARTDSNVLITGETGTSKNAVAAQLHGRGPRAKRSRLLGISRKALWETRKRYGLE